MSDSPATTAPDLLALTAQIVAAHVASNSVAADALPDLIAKVHGALANAGSEPAPEPTPQQQPAVPVRKSIQPDYLVCLEDGAKVTMLKRYLRRRFGLEPDEYRAKWGLPSDYPMVAPNYAARRSTLAKELGLGRKRTAPEATAPAEEEEPLFPADLADDAKAGKHTAESVFGNFGKGGSAAEDEGEEAPAPVAAPKKRGRKPFAQQSMRPARGRRNSAAE